MLQFRFSIRMHCGPTRFSSTILTVNDVRLKTEIFPIFAFVYTFVSIMNMYDFTLTSNAANLNLKVATRNVITLIFNYRYFYRKFYRYRYVPVFSRRS